MSPFWYGGPSRLSWPAVAGPTVPVSISTEPDSATASGESSRVPSAARIGARDSQAPLTWNRSPCPRGDPAEPQLAAPHAEIVIHLGDGGGEAAGRDVDRQLPHPGRVSALPRGQVARGCLGRATSRAQQQVAASGDRGCGQDGDHGHEGDDLPPALAGGHVCGAAGRGLGPRAPRAAGRAL